MMFAVGASKFWQRLTPGPAARTCDKECVSAAAGAAAVL